jgi:DNA invertase Pin-like site-specific DNA recombinase
MTRAIGYVRRSTDRQEESLEQQRAQLEAFAKSKGWTLAQVFEDDAVSGSELQRPGLDQLIAAAKEREVEVVLTWDANRLARPKDPVDGMLILRQLQGSGAKVIYAANGRAADRSFGSDLLSFVEQHQNGDYLRKLSRDTMRGTTDRARRGLWSGGPIPFGFDRLILDGETPKRIVRATNDGGQLVLDAATGAVLDTLRKGKAHGKQDHEVCTLIPSEPSRVRAVRKLFEDFAADVPTRKLREDLNGAGFRTSRGQWFTVQTLRPMLENAAYIGRCVYNRRTLSKWHRYANGASVEREDEGVERRAEGDWIVCEDAWPAIVDRATFERVQLRLTRAKIEGVAYRGNAMKSEYLLTGRVVCGVCGGKLTGTTCTSGKGVKTRYYVCGRHQAGYKNECPKRYTVPADIIEQHVVTLIRCDLRRLRDDDKLHEYVEDELRRYHGSRHDADKQLQRRTAELDQTLANVREHIVALDPKTAEALGLYTKAAELSQERVLVEAKLAATKDKASLPPIGDLRKRLARELERFETIMAEGLVEERRALLASYVDSIKADPATQRVDFGLVPVLLSQMVAGAGFEPATSGL